MFINLSNHPVGSWSKEQIEATKIYGEIIEYPFPQIPVSVSDEEMNRLVSKYFELIMKHDQPVVMLQGEFVFVFRLVTRLKKAGIIAGVMALSLCVGLGGGVLGYYFLNNILLNFYNN